jgi:hypothetical protein
MQFSYPYPERTERLVLVRSGSEPDASDTCSGTLPGEQVDFGGCSLGQFRTRIDATVGRGKKVCRRSDWRNDQPVGRVFDCTIDRGTVGRDDDRCVPR